MASLLLALLLAVPAEAPLPAVLTLPDALRLFRERSFDLLLADAELADRAGRAQVAFLLAVRGPLPAFRVDPELLEQAARLGIGPGDAGALLETAAQARPDLRALERQEARARAALDLARRQRIPEVTLSAQYAQEGTGGSAVTPPTVTVGASLPVPIFYRQQGEVQRAEADLRTQAVQREKAAAQLASEVVTAYGAFAASRKLVDRMRGGLLERAQRARDLTRIQYEKGAARLFELLDAQRAFAQVRAEYLQDLHDLWLNLFKLEAAVGKELRS